METLGVLVVVEKVRRLLLWHNARIHLDKVRDLGTFIEIEAVADPASDLSIERRHASELEEALGSLPIEPWRSATATSCYAQARVPE